MRKYYRKRGHVHNTETHGNNDTKLLLEPHLQLPNDETGKGCEDQIHEGRITSGEDTKPNDMVTVDTSRGGWHRALEELDDGDRQHGHVDSDQHEP